MLNILFTLAITIIKAVFLLLAIYLFYYRVFDYYRAKAHYEKQKIAWTHTGKWRSWPFIGNLPVIIRLLYVMWSRDIKKNIVEVALKMYCGGHKAVMYFHANFCYLVISDPKVVEAMYTTKNKYMTKHRLLKD